MRPGSRFTIIPNPPTAGGQATIKYSGTGKHVVITAPGQPRREFDVPPDTITINPVPDVPVIYAQDDLEDASGSTYWFVERTN